MASIKRRPDGRWRARYRDPDGKEHAQHFDRKVDGERWLDQVRGDLVRGTYIDPDGARTVFQDYAETWQASQVHRHSTAVKTDVNLRLHVLPTFGEKRLGQIRQTDVQVWVRGLQDRLAA